MSEHTITRADIAHSIYTKIGISKRQSREVIDDIIEAICLSLKNGEHVKLPSFGTFSTHEKQARIGRNPKTKKDTEISARRVVNFKPSKLLKDKIKNC